MTQVNADKKVVSLDQQQKNQTQPCVQEVLNMIQ